MPEVGNFQGPRNIILIGLKMAGVWLSVLEYMKYVNGTANSRCVQEGEEIVNAGHIILYGKTEATSSHIKLIALCLQSSAINSDPHEIYGTLSIEPNNKAKIVNMTCSCKAGLGGTCKHISGVLIQCTRVDLSKMETISQTDLKCVWSRQKSAVHEKYHAVPVSQMPCLKGKVPSTTLDVALCSEDVLRDIALLLPECAVNRLRVGRSNDHEVVEESARNYVFSVILNNACQSIVMFRLSSESINFRSDCCNILYSSLMNDSQDEVIEVPQNSSTWHELRKFRVTGSRCYELFTYSGQSWDVKSQKYFWPKSFTNKYVRHGLKYEDNARQAFSAFTGLPVAQCGMVISHSSKWLGYSPDGIILENDWPVALLEIKCPWDGASSTISEAIQSCNFLTRKNNLYTLKKKHKYYGQIQMGLSVLNLKKCYLALYASYDDSLIIVEVEHDEVFSEEMLLIIKKKYFEKMLHVICEHRN